MALHRIRVAYSGTPIAGPAVSTFSWETVDSTVQDGVDALAAVFDIWKTMLVSGLTMTVESEADTINPSTGELTGIVAVTPWTKTGSVGSASCLPPECQALVRWRTGTFVGGKEIRGRTFLPGAASGYVNVDGSVPTTQLAILNNGAALWVGAGSNESVVYSRTHGQAAAIVSASAWGEYASLRSRRD